ncbi:hypothetical protein LTR27_002211 [Elasticomyces elasticus]|nr:hypothetical protein LTR27_002211 [Elasticomyces elasticus]
MAQLNNNTIIGSTNTSIAYNVYHGSDADALRTWMLADSRQATSMTTQLPDIFASNLTDQIFHSAEFQGCVSQKSETLVLRGKMGAGKSTTIGGLIKRSHGMLSVAVASVMFSQDLSSGHDASKVLMRFLSQLAELGDPVQRDHVAVLYRISRDDIPSAVDVAEAITCIANRIVAHRQMNICLFLDGLDEFDGQEKLCALLRHIKVIQAKSQCGVVMTSRVHELSVENTFGKCSTLTLSADAGDISSYVHNFGPGYTVKALQDRVPGLDSRIVAAVQEGAGGLFLLAKLNTAYIMTTRTERQFNNAVREAFDRNIERLLQSNVAYPHSRENDVAKELIVFTRDSERELQSAEMLHLLALRGSTLRYDETDFYQPDSLSVLARGLIDITEHGEVRFVHHSLKIHLQHSPRWKQIFPDANLVFAARCVKYLRLTRFPGGHCVDEGTVQSRLHQYTFLKYAAIFWETHFAKADPEDPCFSSLQASVQEYLQDDHHVSFARQVRLLPAHTQNVRLLGKGSYADVMVIQDQSHRFYAQKVTYSNPGKHQRMAFEAAIKHEFETMQKLCHHHIVSILSCVYTPIGCSLVMLPVADYNLVAFIYEDLTAEKLATLDQWFGCLISALSYVHEQGFKHENITAANVLIKDDRIYLAGFGKAIDYDESSFVHMSRYWAPEQHWDELSGREADVFSLGCIFSEMLMVRQGKTLNDYHQGQKTDDIWREDTKVFRANLPMIEAWLEGLPEVNAEGSSQSLLLDVVLNMLTEDPSKRCEAGVVRKKLQSHSDRLFCKECF